MRGEINPAFSEALRQMGRPTTPEDLRRRGVRKLRSVGMAEIALLIEKAVNRTLMERTIGPLQEEQLAELLHDAENQFTSQLKTFQDLADSRDVVEHHKREMKAELARLREALSHRRGFVEQAAQERRNDPERRRELAIEVQALIDPLLPPGPLRGDGKAAVVGLVALVEARVARALAEQRGEFELELARQERRVSKLVESLERTEKVLARVAASKDLEEGIESLYRTVQGLDGGDASSQQKRELLSKIFEANLALRQARAAAEGSAAPASGGAGA